MRSFQNQTVALVCLFLSVANYNLLAGSATWLANPANGNWNNAANWTAGGPPNGSTDLATFAMSNQTSISLSATTEVTGINFGAGANNFNVNIAPNLTLTVSGSGITNSSGVTQNFVTNVDESDQFGTINFTNGATAGNNVTFTNSGWTLSNAFPGGQTQFFDNSNAGNATFINNGNADIGNVGGLTIFFDTASANHGTFNNGGGSGSGAFGGVTSFAGNSTAGNGTLNNYSGMTNGARGGSIFFQENSTAGNAILRNNGNDIVGSLHAVIDFFDNSKAGTATFTNDGGGVSGGNGCGIFFTNQSSADDATFTNNGGTVSGARGSIMDFYTEFGSPTAANATLIANGGAPGADGALILIGDDALGGTSRIEVFGNGALDISYHNAPGVTVGSIEGTGEIFLGANKLTVGSNNLSKTFSGVMQDGGENGGTLGSLGKIGTGTLSLTSANTYTGGTTVSAGTLEALHDRALGNGNVTILGPGATLTLHNGATNDYIADDATVNIISSTTLNLNFSGVDVIGTLIIDGVAQRPGLYGTGGRNAIAQNGLKSLPSDFVGTGQVLAELPVAVSRKMHGATAFDDYLPLSGSPGIECRAPAAGNMYQIIVSFLNNATFNSASVTSGQGIITGTSGSGTTTVTINLGGVTNAQTINVTLFGLNDGMGMRDLVIPMSVLIGDTNGNGSVNASDVSQTKAQAGQPVTGSNFREDVNGNGAINASDVSLVKSKTGTALP